MISKNEKKSADVIYLRKRKNTVSSIRKNSKFSAP